MKISFPVRIYIIALILRLIPVLFTHGLGIGLDDMFQYDMLARSLSSGNGFRWYAQEDLKLLEPYVNFDLSTANDYDPKYGLYTSFRAPLYPVFLAIVYFFNGLDFSRFFAARLAQVIFLGAPLAALTYFVAKHLSLFSLSSGLKDENVSLPKEHRDNARLLKGKKKAEKVARISAWIVACYPMLLIYPLGLGTENLFFLLLLSSFLFLLKSIEKPTVLNALFSGILLALTALTRSVVLPFAGLAILYLFYLHRRQALLIAVTFVLATTPWVIRNSVLHHKFTGIETSMGYNLYLGYHPQGNGSFIFGPSLDLLSIMDDAERNEIGTQKAVEFIKDQPERIIPLAVNRLGFFFGLEKRVLMYFYSNNLIGQISKPLLLTIASILLLPFVVISVSTAFGLSLLRWNSQTALLLLLLTFYLLPHVFILSEDRFHLALIPYFAILAAYFWVNGIQSLCVCWRESLYGKLAVTFAILAFVLLLANWGFELTRDADRIAALLAPDGNTTYFPY